MLGVFWKKLSTKNSRNLYLNPYKKERRRTSLEKKRKIKRGTTLLSFSKSKKQKNENYRI